MIKQNLSFIDKMTLPFRAMVHSFIQKKITMRVSGMQTSAVAGAECTMLTVPYMRASGSMMSAVDRGC